MIEAPAKHINIVSKPIPMPDFEQKDGPESQSADKPEKEKPSDSEPKDE